MPIAKKMQNIQKNSPYNSCTYTMNVALYPMPIQWGDKDKNLDLLQKSMQNLHNLTDLLILPETFSTGYLTGDKEKIRPLAEKNSGETIERLKLLARKHNVAIAGSFIADTGGLLCNRAFFIEPGGDETFADKRHLFTFANEHKVFSPGYDRLHVRYMGWEIAMVVCYDIRFPVWCRNVDNNYDILIAVANWPTVRTNAWQTLLPARAIENLSYLCAVNCQGTDLAGFEYDGFSQVFDYKGGKIGIKPEDSDFIYATLSKDKLDKFRDKFRAWADADKFSFCE